MNLLNTADHKTDRATPDRRRRCWRSAWQAQPAIAIRVMASNGSIDHFDALTSLDHALLGVFVVLPLWFGIATVVVPLQIGTNRLAFPKLSAAALWAYVGGVIAVIEGYTQSPAPSGGRTVFSAVPLPGSLAKLADTKGADLVVLGMLLGAVATVLMAVNLVATIASRRAHGLTMGRLPYFSWSVLVGGIGVALATPVFIGGLTLVWVDQHFGGSFFTSSAANAFWTHAIWLGGRPEALLGAAFVLGAGSDIIATATGRRNELDQVTRAAHRRLRHVRVRAVDSHRRSGRRRPGAVQQRRSPLLPILAAGVVLLTLARPTASRPQADPVGRSARPDARASAWSALVDGLLRLTTDNRGRRWSEASLVLFAIAIPVDGRDRRSRALGAQVRRWPRRRTGGVAGRAGDRRLASRSTTAPEFLLGADGAPTSTRPPGRAVTDTARLAHLGRRRHRHRRLRHRRARPRLRRRPQQDRRCRPLRIGRHPRMGRRIAAATA